MSLVGSKWMDLNGEDGMNGSYFAYLYLNGIYLG